jgi:hypothetical protein
MKADTRRVQVQVLPPWARRALLEGSKMVAVMIVLFSLGIANLAALIWVAATAADERHQRQRRVDRDFDLRGPK